MPPTLQAELKLLTAGGTGSAFPGGGSTDQQERREISESLKDIAKNAKSGVSGLFSQVGTIATIATAVLGVLGLGRLLSGTEILDDVFGEKTSEFFKGFSEAAAEQQQFAFLIGELNSLIGGLFGKKELPAGGIEIPSSQQIAGEAGISEQDTTLQALQKLDAAGILPFGKKFDPADTLKEVQDILEDNIVSQEELLRLTEMDEDAKKRLTEIAKKSLNLQSEGKELTTEQREEWDTILTTELAIIDAIQLATDKELGKNSAIKETNSSLKEQLGLLNKLNDKDDDSGRKRAAVQAGASFTIRGQEGTYRGRVYNTLALGGEKVFAVRTTG